MQTKDIPDQPIIDFIIKNGSDKKYTWFEIAENDLGKAMPENIPRKLVLSKIRSMIKRKILDGCDCGCRGDFTLVK